jgi:RimJ/RimL family protein N-acetyltransferase/predicted N-acetyltransferase YhbS
MPADAAPADAGQVVVRASVAGATVSAVPEDLPFETETLRLRLRRPTMADLPFQIALHTDPALYAHAPAALVADPAVHERRLAEWIGQWEDHGFGYWLVEDAAEGRPLGFAGVRPDGDGLNLYYRLRREAHGRGLATEAAREAVALATEWIPGSPVRAVIRPGHETSLRTARRSGLVEAGVRRHAEDPPDQAPSVMLEAPQVHRADRVEDPDEIVELWQRVNDAGGSVGFTPGAPRADVVAALRRHEEEMAEGLAFLGVLRDPGGVLLGLGWWTRSRTPLLAHARWLYRLMVEPSHQGRNLGRVLMAGLHRLARGDRAELLTLDYRSGSGVGEFYARCGYTEVGRIPGAIRVAPGDERDDVIMTRRVDGAPLRPHGHT